MNKHIEAKIQKVISLVSEIEKRRNRLLEKQTERVLLAIYYLKNKEKVLKLAT